MRIIGTELNATVVSDVYLPEMNQVFESLEIITVNGDTYGAESVSKGSEYWLTDSTGSIATIVNGRVVARIDLSKFAEGEKIVAVGGLGYAFQSFTDGMTLLPGDIGSVSNRALQLQADGVINNMDFSVWLTLLEAFRAGTATPYEIALGDFTRNGQIDEADYKLWLQSYEVSR